MPKWYSSQLSRRAIDRGPSRREVLAASLAAGLTLLGGCASTRGKQQQSMRPRVGIVGAGLAGLSCAHELQRRGADVELFDARRRVGGRVLTLHDVVLGKRIEGGGEFVGANHPLWQAFAAQFKLPLLEVAESDDLQSPLLFGADRIDGAASDRLWEEVDAGFEALTQQAHTVNPQWPWLANDAARLDDTDTAAAIASLRLPPLAARLIALELANDNSVPVARQSLLGNLAQIAGGGHEAYFTQTEAFRCGDGNDALPRALATAIGPTSIRLDRRVVAIRHDADNASLRLGDGTERAFDAIVLAIPPSLWPRLTVSPALAESLRPQMGVAAKAIFRTESRPWAQRGESSQSIGDGPVGLVWDSSLGQGGTAPFGLTAFSGGDQYPSLIAHAADNSLARTLSKMSGADGLKLARVMDWPADQLTAGSYSFPAPGQVTRLGPILTQPIGRLFIAGEHTSYAFIGYMEGALQSGHRVAGQISSRLNLA